MRSLREAADAPWFYEALFEFSQKTIPYGTDYTTWRKRMAKRMKAYREVYFAGPSRSTDAGRQPKPATQSLHSYVQRHGDDNPWRSRAGPDLAPARSREMHRADDNGGSALIP